MVNKILQKKKPSEAQLFLISQKVFLWDLEFSQLIRQEHSLQLPVSSVQAKELQLWKWALERRNPFQTFLHMQSVCVVSI